jgi:hypothetical protein
LQRQNSAHCIRSQDCAHTAHAHRTVLTLDMATRTTRTALQVISHELIVSNKPKKALLLELKELNFRPFPKKQSDVRAFASSKNRQV